MNKMKMGNNLKKEIQEQLSGFKYE